MPEVTLERRPDGVALLTLNRPDARNALSMAALNDLDQALMELEAADDVRCVVLTGAGTAFCAGLDLEELERDPTGLLFHPAPQRLRELQLPIVAAVNGAAVTGGLELALAADFRVASERAKFADTHALVGLVPGWGMMTGLPMAVGEARAREMSLTARFVSAQEAERIGLVNRVVASDDLLDSALTTAGAIAENDAEAVAALIGMYRNGARARVAVADLEERHRFRTWSEHLDSNDIARRREIVIERGRRLQRGK